MDYLTYYYDGDAVSIGASGVGAMSFIPGLIVGVVMIVGMWKLFEKAGKPGWTALIPIYNDYVLFEIICGRGIAFLRLLIPFYNIYWYIKSLIVLAKAYGKDTAFGIGLIFLSPIFMCILGFGKDQYLGPQEM